MSKLKINQTTNHSINQSLAARPSLPRLQVGPDLVSLLVAALASGLRDSVAPDYRAASLMILSQLCARVTLSEAALAGGCRGGGVGRGRVCVGQAVGCGRRVCGGGRRGGCGAAARRTPRQ